MTRNHRNGEHLSRFGVGSTGDVSKIANSDLQAGRQSGIWRPEGRIVLLLIRARGITRLEKKRRGEDLPRGRIETAGR